MKWTSEQYRNTQSLLWEFRRLPPIRGLLEQQYLSLKAKHKCYLPSVEESYESILYSLFRDGISVETLDLLSIPKTSEMTSTAKRLLHSEALTSEPLSTVWVASEVINQYPDILLWGAHESLLNLVENYIQVPIYYLGAEIKREIANGSNDGVRQWHIDKEDRNIIKLIIYLNDVDEFGGPFEFISKTLSRTAAKALGYSSGLVSDQVMSQYIPPDYWCPVVGASNLAIFVDTCQVFHHAKPPKARDRDSITFHYTSQLPLMCFEKNIFVQSPALQGKLSKRQVACMRQH